MATRVAFSRARGATPSQTECQCQAPWEPRWRDPSPSRSARTAEAIPTSAILAKPVPPRHSQQPPHPCGPMDAPLARTTCAGRPPGSSSPTMVRRPSTKATGLKHRPSPPTRMPPPLPAAYRSSESDRIFSTENHSPTSKPLFLKKKMNISQNFSQKPLFLRPYPLESCLKYGKRRMCRHPGGKGRSPATVFCHGRSVPPHCC